MNRGIYFSAGGMMLENFRTDTVANNLANCNTAGYKKDINVTHDFETMLIERINDGENPPPKIGNLGTGALAWENYVVHTAGGIMETGDPLNVAITGNGYFTVQTPAGVRYTRNGNFTLNNQNQIVTLEGNLVLGVGNVPLMLVDEEDRSININQNGEVYNGEQLIGQFQMVDVEDTRNLSKEAGLLFRMADGAAQRPFTGRILAGALEASNVNVVEEMVNLITSYRAYEVNAKGVQTHDQLNEKAANEVGSL